MRELAGDLALLGDDQLELRNAVRSFLAKKVDEAAVRRQVETPDRFDRGTWDRMVGELGLPALAVPETRGGFGATALDVVVVAEELGAALAPQPFLLGVLAAAGLVTVETEAADALLEAVTSGSVVTVVSPPFAVGAPGRGDDLQVSESADGIRVTGTREFVVNAGQADRYLVYAQAPDGPVLLALDRGPGIQVTERDSLDFTRPQGALTFERAAATVLVRGEAAAAAWHRAQRWALLVLAGEEVGVARRCLAMSVEYAGVREQSGRLIGSHQAIKHRCTDMLLALDLARAAVRDAAVAVRDGRSDADSAVHMARYLAQQSADLATRECVQVLGGIGFTWEHPAHLYFRRARADAALLGTTTDQLDAFAALNLDTASGSRT